MVDGRAMEIEKAGDFGRSAELVDDSGCWFHDYNIAVSKKNARRGLTFVEYAST
jgi:hypothetical protein